MDRFLEKVIELTNSSHIHVVARRYGVSAAACTGISFVGGLFGGPLGLAVGGLLGGLTAYGISHWTNRNQFSFFLNLAQNTKRFATINSSDQFVLEKETFQFHF